MPVIFAPFKWQDRGIFMDGGVVRETNIDAAIMRCLELTDGDPAKITVDVMDPLASKDLRKLRSSANMSTIDFITRTDKISSIYNFRQDRTTMKRKYPKVHFRHNIGQQKGYIGLNELNFDGEYTWNL